MSLFFLVELPNLDSQKTLKLIIGSDECIHENCLGIFKLQKSIRMERLSHQISDNINIHKNFEWVKLIWCKALKVGMGRCNVVKVRNCTCLLHTLILILVSFIHLYLYLPPSYTYTYTCLLHTLILILILALHTLIQKFRGTVLRDKILQKTSNLRNIWKKSCKGRECTQVFLCLSFKLLSKLAPSCRNIRLP